MSDKWKKANQPPPPLFLGEKERDLVKQVNDEIIEKVVGQQIIYFALDIEHTNYHALYGEAIEKTFLPPIRVYALVEYGGEETSYLSNIAIDEMESITVKFHKKRINEDVNLEVRIGDFVRYGDNYYEITKTSEPKLLFGQIDHKFEVHAQCIRAREGLFDAR
mgnify:FL=1|tara:strand:+ start:640 stop:1128 length:489 start_codon:yes stop_codon:yes gene_type:complete